MSKFPLIASHDFLFLMLVDTVLRLMGSLFLVMFLVVECEEDLNPVVAVSGLGLGVGVSSMESVPFGCLVGVVFEGAVAVVEGGSGVTVRAVGVAAIRVGAITSLRDELAEGDRAVAGGTAKVVRFRGVAESSTLGWNDEFDIATDFGVVLVYTGGAALVDGMMGCRTAVALGVAT